MRLKSILAVFLALALPGALSLILVACAATGPVPGPAALKLDPSQSSLTATAIKNEVKPVAVHFPGLHGWADPSSGVAKLEIPLTTLSTGDLTRDFNVKTLFFETGKLADYGTAGFTLAKVDTTVSGLAEGTVVTAQGHGSLTLHGASLPLEGPLSFIRQGKSLRVHLGDGWVVAIDKTSLVEALANLNKNCPQPHRVGNAVAISGDLVFVP
jgi:polyisoprenoid-binding protein YceI